MKGNEAAIEAKAITRDASKPISKRMKLIREELGNRQHYHIHRKMKPIVSKRSGVNISYISESLGYTNLE